MAQSTWQFRSLLNQARAVFELNQLGNVVWSNEKAKNYLGKFFFLKEDRLRIKYQAADEALQVMIGNLHAPTLPAPGSSATYLLLQQGDGRPLILHAVFLESDISTERAAIIIVTDPDDLSVPPEPVLQTLFGLTPAEARLARGIARGLDLEAIAQQARTTVGTARAQLKVVFDKTSTCRQAQLAVLVTRISTALE